MTTEEGTQPEVTAETKFEMRGFMTDAPEAAEGEVEMSPEEADALMGGAAPQEGAEAGEEEVPAPAPKNEAKIRIGDREFANADEAWTYAQELEREKLAADAFRHGVETAQKVTPGNPLPAAQQPEEDEKFDEEFYANPKEYLKKRDEKIAHRIQSQIEQQQTIKQRNEATWNKFYNDYPDLGRSQELVQLTLQQNWNDLAHVETEKALKIIAEKVRMKKKEMLADMMPGKELPKVKATTSPTGTAGVTRETQTEKSVNFVTQFRNMKKNRITKK